MSAFYYIVTTKKGIDINQTVARDLESASYSPQPSIPSRGVQKVSNAFKGSTRNDEFILSKCEAATLRTDSRVEFVQKIPSGGFVGDGVTESIYDYRSGAKITFGDSMVGSRFQRRSAMGINHDFWTGSNSNLHTNAAFKYQTNKETHSKMPNMSKRQLKTEIKARTNRS